MKYAIFFTLVLFAITSCQKEETITELQLDSPAPVDFRSNAVGKPNITYSATELIVQYHPTVTEDQKDNYREQFQVPSYEVCAHCDGTIEKWDFGPGADIEHKYATAKEEEAEAEGVFLVDREFDFPADAPPPVLAGGSDNLAYAPRIVTANTGVTVAVLDTGVDANYPTFSSAFLYQSGGDVAEIQSGWDYQEGDDNCYDENPDMHGTAVAGIISNYLNNQMVPHQILPIRIARADGTISLFDAYCGINYAAGLVEIIQMSFGWYDNGEDPDAFTNDIFSSLMERHPDVLFVTSAGNSSSDNDYDLHYPSNYDYANNIAVAAANEPLEDLAEFSNYGALSVDFLAAGTNVDFVNADNVSVSISGTSFAAPRVTAIAARELYLSGMTLSPSELLSTLISLGTPLNTGGQTKYEKILLP